MIAVIDYGVGNLFSLESSFKAIGEEAVVTGDAAIIRKADRVILPGVGAFGDAARKLRESGLDQVTIEQAKSGKPLLGICLGMQMLFEKSYEYGEHDGLGLIPGQVVFMENRIPAELKIPHIGWNPLIFTEHQTENGTEKGSRLFKYIKEGDAVYFVHSYYAEGCADHTSAVAEYGKLLTASVETGNVFGCQFHPEKSGPVGLKILKAFCEV